jgi:hypothetical protein
MYRDQTPLPDKVRESGDGYTLSGKPLDPNSAAAKPYLSRGGRGGSISGPSITPKPAAVVTAEKVEKDDPMEGIVEQESNKENVKEGDNEENKEKAEEKAMEVDTVTKIVETQTKELSIDDEDKKNIAEKITKKAGSKPATPSPTSSST